MVTIKWDHIKRPQEFTHVHSKLWPVRCSHADGEPKEGIFYVYSKNVRNDTILCETCARKEGFIW